MNQRNLYIDELLSAYLDGQTTPDESARVERLLAGHDEHRRTVDEMRSLGNEIKSLARHQLDDRFRHRVLQQVDQTATGQRVAEQETTAIIPSATNVSGHVNTGPFLRAGLIAAALAATVLMALFVVKRLPSDPSPQIAQTKRPATPPVTSLQSDTHSSITNSGSPQPSAAQPSAAAPIDPEHLPKSPAGDVMIAKSAGQSGGSPDRTPEDLAVATISSDSPDLHALPDSRRADEPNEVHSSNPQAKDVTAAAISSSKSTAENHRSGGLLLVIDVKLTPRGREQKSFEKALADHEIAFHSTIQANSKLEKALLASRFLAADEPAHENQPTSAEATQQQLVYVISAVGLVDHLWRSMLDQTDCFASVSFGVVMQPEDLAVFRRLNRAAKDQWAGAADRSADQRMAAFHLILSSSWRGAVGSAVDGIMGLMPQPSSGLPKSTSGGASDRASGTPHTGGAPQSNRWLDENLPAEVLFVVK